MEKEFAQQTTTMTKHRNVFFENSAFLFGHETDGAALGSSEFPFPGFGDVRWLERLH